MPATRINTQDIATNGVTTPDVVDAAITLPKLGALTTAGDLLGHDGTSHIRFPIGSADRVLSVNDTGNGFSWRDLNASATVGVVSPGLSWAASGSNILLSVDQDLASLSQLATTGFAARTNNATEAWATRTLTAGSTKLSIINPQGIAGDPTLDVVPANILHSDLGALTTGDPHTQYTLRTGRTGSTNDTILSSSTDGMLTGSTTASMDLTLRPNSASATGYVEATRPLKLYSLATAMGVAESPFRGIWFPNTLSVNGLGESMTLFDWDGTIDCTLAAAKSRGIQLHPTITNAAGSSTLPSLTSFDASPTYTAVQANTQMGGGGTLIGTDSFPTFQVSGSGSWQVLAIEHYASQITLNTGVVMSSRQGFSHTGKIGAGTVTNDIGFICDDLTVTTLGVGFQANITAGSGKWAFQSVGTAGSGFLGPVRIGDAVAPTKTLEVAGTISTSGAQSGTHRVISIEDTTTLNASNTGIIRHGICDAGVMIFNADPGGLSGLMTLETVGSATAAANGVDMPAYVGMRIEFNALGNGGGASATTIGSMAAFTNVMHSTATTGTFTVTGGHIGFDDGLTLTASSGATLAAVSRIAVRVWDPAITGTGTVTLPLNIGLDVANQTQGSTLRAAVRSQINVSGTVAWGIYASGTAPHLFGGTLYGSTATAGNLTLAANSADQTGSIILDRKVALWPSIPTVTTDTPPTDVLSFAPTTVSINAGGAALGRLNVVRAAGTITCDGTASNIIRGYGFDTAVSVNEATSYSLFQSFATFTLASAKAMGTAVEFYANTTYQATSGVSAGSVGSAYFAFNDANIHKHQGSTGTYTAGIVTSFRSFPTLQTTASGGTAVITTRRGIHIGNVSTSGAGTNTVTDNIAVDVAGLTATNTPLSFRSAGATVEMRHAGPVRIGSSSAGPTGSSILHVDGGLTLKRTTVNDVAYTALLTDCIIEYTALTANRVLTLPVPATAAAGKVYLIKKGVTGTSVAITITPSSGQIDGAANIPLSASYGSVQVYCTGTAWFSISTG